MSNKHTPGPWMFKNKGYRIEVRTDELHTYAFGVYDEANARLISAAPDLLDSLIRAERKLSAYVGVCTGDKELNDAVLPMVRAAIAKATKNN